MQGLLPHLPMEEQPAPPTPAPPPIANGNAEALPLPPCFLELVKQQAERVLPGKACTPMLLQRANMLMQDTVDAACMCMRAHVDSPLLLKHLLGTEHYQSFLTSDKAKALALAEEEGALASRELDAWSSLVTEHVGEVRHRPGDATWHLEPGVIAAPLSASLCPSASPTGPSHTEPALQAPDAPLPMLRPARPLPNPPDYCIRRLPHAPPPPPCWICSPPPFPFPPDHHHVHHAPCHLRVPRMRRRRMRPPSAPCSS